MVERENVKRVGIVLVTGDRGLAGAFNTQHHPRGHADGRGGPLRGGGAVLRRGRQEGRLGAELPQTGAVTASYTGFTDRPAFANAREIGEELTARYVDEDLDRVELIYNRFVSPLTQHVWRQTLLPLQQADVVGEGAAEERQGEERKPTPSGHRANRSGAMSPTPSCCSPA